MAGLLTLRNLLWLITTAAEILLLVSLFRRRMQSTHTAFLVYIASTITQSALAVYIYTRWGLNSTLASVVIWSSQGVVICLRFLAVFEMARRILSAYRGLWSLAKRLLAVIGLGVVGYSLLVAQKQMNLLVLNLDRGLELAIAAFVVALLLFARFYLLPVRPLDRALAIGFCLYSCFYVVNDTLFERLMGSDLALWGFLDIVTFLASLSIWSQAVLAYSPVSSNLSEPAVIAKIPYAAISPELNVRLQQLNGQLAQLLRVEKQRS
jgi:hypothetical protein